MNKYLFLFLLISFAFCQGQVKKNNHYPENDKNLHETIIKKYVINCAKNYNYKFQMKEWQSCLDEGLQKDSTVSYLWQQKAMPYFKFRKYEVGMHYLNKAVLYNPKEWLGYRAFIKCIFMKSYKDAIDDFNTCLDLYGNNYEMDHSYKFYLALSYLQLNDFNKAEKIFIDDIGDQIKHWGEAHYLSFLYLGISMYEQDNFKEAIVEFDNALEQYENFSEAQYYKGLCLLRIQRIEEGSSLIIESKKNSEKGYSINEDNVVYEPYPYQIVW